MHLGSTLWRIYNDSGEGDQLEGLEDLGRDVTKVLDEGLSTNPVNRNALALVEELCDLARALRPTLGTVTSQYFPSLPHTYLNTAFSTIIWEAFPTLANLYISPTLELTSADPATPSSRLFHDGDAVLDTAARLLNPREAYMLCHQYLHSIIGDFHVMSVVPKLWLVRVALALRYTRLALARVQGKKISSFLSDILPHFTALGELYRPFSTNELQEKLIAICDVYNQQEVNKTSGEFLLETLGQLQRMFPPNVVVTDANSGKMVDIIGVALGLCEWQCTVDTFRWFAQRSANTLDCPVDERQRVQSKFLDAWALLIDPWVTVPPPLGEQWMKIYSPRHLALQTPTPRPEKDSILTLLLSRTTDLPEILAWYIQASVPESMENYQQTDELNPDQFLSRVTAIVVLWYNVLFGSPENDLPGIETVNKDGDDLLANAFDRSVAELQAHGAPASLVAHALPHLLVVSVKLGCNTRETRYFDCALGLGVIIHQGLNQPHLRPHWTDKTGTVAHPFWVWFLVVAATSPEERQRLLGLDLVSQHLQLLPTEQRLDKLRSWWAVLDRTPSEELPLEEWISWWECPQAWVLRPTLIKFINDSMAALSPDDLMAPPLLTLVQQIAGSTKRWFTSLDNCSKKEEDRQTHGMQKQNALIYCTPTIVQFINLLILITLKTESHQTIYSQWQQYYEAQIKPEGLGYIIQLVNSFTSLGKEQVSIILW
ncbi:hypothetical protein IWQ62_001335 [Dispira parvispora]|uniref:Uncharacterized protein n=1 Tax=Dispira parvispora TaxID=1520584 RepID=A0A9W8AWC3_9FUNG|nr:hypothetical protein IWQ62_001335 [Dispira parvispora]